MSESTSVTHLLDPDNAWSVRVRDRLVSLPPDLTELVRHLGTASEFWNWRYKVDTPWKRRTRQLLKADGAEDLVRYAVRELAAKRSFHGAAEENTVIRELGQSRADSPARGLAIGFALAAGWIRQDPGPLAADLALLARKNVQAMEVYHKVDDDLAGAAFASLGELPGPAVLDELWDLHYWVPSARHPHKVLAKSVKKSAARLGVPPHEVAERTVPRHGLEKDGTLTLGWIGRGALWWNLALDAVISVHASGQVTVDWIDKDGTATRTTHPFRSPTGYKSRTWSDDVDGVRRQAKRIETTLAEERTRLRALAGEGRTWCADDWRRFYRDHPVTGVVTRSLNWEYEVSDGGGFRPLDPGAGTDAATLPSTARVRLRAEDSCQDS
ncbi:DUF4132 domain-containing protein [Streptomyces xanthii]|uniref:DUF4132 domain-containing protein n=1 Tax=Streptomyces xanthii TaxID=2768069 RepID=A0A7H1BKD5_9ACTN|nr:DUF4132 domain-containing protein [Streptomyces xanthii]QNS09190.1 DUF4132 domain-containing protein [Streptomyces xanthii]